MKPKDSASAMNSFDKIIYIFTQRLPFMLVNMVELYLVRWLFGWESVLLNFVYSFSPNFPHPAFLSVSRFKINCLTYDEL